MRTALRGHEPREKGSYRPFPFAIQGIHRFGKIRFVIARHFSTSARRSSSVFVALALLLTVHADAFALLAPVPTDAQAQQAHAQGACGKLGPGTGLGADGRGWVVSMLPGRHEFRMVRGGTVGVTVVKKTVMDFDAGRPYYIVVEGAPADGHLQWKVPGSDWGPVSKLFLYPPQGNIYQRTP